MADAERQLAVEGAQRVRVAACALTAGLFFFGGQLWVAVVGAKEPTIGVLQGLVPAFHGLAAAGTDPRTIHEQFLVGHQYALIASFLISNLGALGMLVPLHYLAAAEMARSPTPSRIASQLALFGPILLAVFLPAFEISLILGAHSYLSHTARDAAAITAARPKPNVADDDSERSVDSKRSSRRSSNAMTMLVTISATSAGAHISEKKWAPLIRTCPSTIRLVRLDPGRNSEPALESRRHP